MAEAIPNDGPRGIDWVWKLARAARRALRSRGARREPDERILRLVRGLNSRLGRPGRPEVPEIKSLPDDVLILIQNVGRMAFAELITRTTEDPEFQTVLKKVVPDRVEASTGVRRSDVAQIGKAEALERASPPPDASDPTVEQALADEAVKRWPTFTSRAKLHAYVIVVGRNKAFKQVWKHRKREAAAGVDGLANHTAPAGPDEVVLKESWESAEQRKGRRRLRLQDVELGLPQDLRIALVLSQYLGLSSREVAQVVLGAVCDDPALTQKERDHRVDYQGRLLIEKAKKALVEKLGVPENPSEQG